MQGESNGISVGTDSGSGRYDQPADHGGHAIRKQHCTGMTTALARPAMAQRSHDATLKHHEPRSYAAVAAAARSCSSAGFDLQVHAELISRTVMAVAYCTLAVVSKSTQTSEFSIFVALQVADGQTRKLQSLLPDLNNQVCTPCITAHAICGHYPVCLGCVLYEAPCMVLRPR